MSNARVVIPMLLLAAIVLATDLANAATHHVTPTGSPAGDGTMASPYDLATALTVMAPGDAVLIANGPYTWTESVSGLIPIQDDCVIEGGFDPDTWAKTPSSATSITVVPELHAFQGLYGYYVGIDASQRSGFSVRDLALSVLPDGASGTYEHRGISVYGVHLDQCSDYVFLNVSITAGPASGGEPGEAGADGVDGMPGDAGSRPTTTVCGVGGAGGAGAGSPPTPATTECYGPGAEGYSISTFSRNGGSGGSGGGCGFFTTDGGRGGYGGAGFGYGAAVPGGAGGAGGAPNCDAPFFPGKPGAPGTAGTDGLSQAPGQAPISAANRGTYFKPEAAFAGKFGYGGSGGGGGGGGGAAWYADWHCHPPAAGIGGAGGGGGGGGGGALGGKGGYGGGSSYAVYLSSNGANTWFSGSYLSGAAGPGGEGGAGGKGGAPGSGGSGSVGSGSSADGGAGGAGGRGGDGGRGQDGTDGESVAVMTASGTAPDLSTVQADDRLAPAGFALHASQPNPAASFTRIAYELPHEANVALRVYDAQGRSVRLLASGDDAPGRKSVKWDLRDDHGARVRAGIYFYRFTADRFEAFRRVIVLD